MEGKGSILVVKLHFFKNSANLVAASLPSLPSCFKMYADAQFLDQAKALAIGTERPVQVAPVLGTRPRSPKSCCTSFTIVLGVKPASSIARLYRSGFIVLPTWRFVFIFTWSYLKVLKS